MKENIRSEKKSCNGITLITLILTVLILVIIAGIIIDITVDGKLFDRAQDVVDKSEKQVTEHQEMSNEVRNFYK